MCASPVEVGILGFAHGHVNAYCERWRASGDFGVQVSAGWDHDAGRLAEAARQHGVRPCESAKELLELKSISAVVIAAETSLHAELVELAASAGKAIILQKPLALTMDEADRIVEAVGRADVPFTLAWQMRADPQNLEMRAMVRDGTIGRILMARRRHTLATHTWPGFENSWHVSPRHNRDIWADDSSHAIDWMYWTLGMPCSVTAELGSLLNPKIPNDNGVAIFRYADGKIAEVCCSFTCVAGENTTEIVGDKGVIVQNYGDAPSANVPRGQGAVGLKWYLEQTKEWTCSRHDSPPNHGHRIAGLAGPLAEFLRGGPPIATAAEGRDVLRLVLACYDSSEQGRRIRL